MAWQGGINLLFLQSSTVRASFVRLSSPTCWPKRLEVNPQGAEFCEGSQSEDGESRGTERNGKEGLLPSPLQIASYGHSLTIHLRALMQENR